MEDAGSSRGAAHRCTIGRGHNAAKHSFLSAIVKAVLADWPGCKASASNKFYVVRVDSPDCHQASFSDNSYLT